MAETAEQNEQQDHSEPSSAQFECNICLDTAKDAVISYCGHLFCWPCLNQWLETKPNHQTCPVCKAGISRDKVIPLYGRGSADSTDPRTKTPPRPQAQRPEPETRRNFGGFNFGDSQRVHMSFGIGAFPFSVIGGLLNFNIGRPAPARGQPYYQESEAMSKFFLWIAIILFMCMIFY